MRTIPTWLILPILAFSLCAAACGGAGNSAGAAGDLPAVDASTLPAPQNIQAMAGDEQVTLSWDDVGEADEYVIFSSEYRLPNSDFDRTEVISSPSTISSLENGTTYHFVVLAVNVANDELGQWPVEVTATPVPDDVVKDVKVDSGNRFLNVTWSPMDGAAGYHVYHGESPEVRMESAFVEVTQPVYSDSNVTNGKTYYYSVAAIFEGGYETPLSPSVSGSPEFTSDRAMKATTSAPAEGDKFGYALAVHGASIAVGAPGDNSGAGAIYMMSYGQKEAKQKLTASGSHGLGGSLAYCGDLVVSSAGSYVYVFDYSHGMWEQIEKIWAQNHSSIACASGKVFIGIGSDNGNAGAVYVYSKYDQHTPVNTLTASDAKAGNLFGSSLSASGCHLLVGDGKGGVYHFYCTNNWSEQQKIDVGDQTNHVLAMEEDEFIAAAPYTSSGIAYVYRSDGNQWVEDGILDGSDTNGFPRTVSISGDMAVVGAYEYVKLFRRNEEGTWVDRGTFSSSQWGSDGFGRSVGAVDNGMIVGDPYEDVQRGAVYMY
jgi:hypothetical protein